MGASSDVYAAALMCAAQLTDDFVAGLFPGVGTMEALRAQLMRTTAAQRQEDQQDRCALMAGALPHFVLAL